MVGIRPQFDRYMDTSNSITTVEPQALLELTRG
jgi:hypothetical protein